MASYLKDQVNSDWLLKNIVAYALCYVNIWMNAEEPRTAEAYE